MENTVESAAESALVHAAPAEHERQWAAGAHLAAILMALATSWVAGIAGAFAALVIWMLVRERSAFAAEHAREALNFNLSMFIYACLAVAAVVVLVGATVLTLGLGIILTAPAGLALLLAAAALAVVWVVCSVIATVKAWNGESYRYPLTIRLVD